MIIVKIHGGLGNQMFQYALGRNLSLIHNIPFKIDSSYLQQKNQFGRSLGLQNLNTVFDEATPRDIKKYRGTFQKILDKMLPETKQKKVSDILRNQNIFNQNVLNRSDGYFDGHWNSEKYFTTNAETIRADFTLKRPLGTKTLEISRLIELNPSATSIHVRRKDYVSVSKVSNIFNLLPMSYYETAMKTVLEKYPDTLFFLFSDDMTWVNKNFPKNYPITFVSSPEIADYEEIILMTMCRHNIIANSSFSWWGAWLNQNPNKIIIAPHAWFKNEQKNNNDIIPNTWIKI